MGVGDWREREGWVQRGRALKVWVGVGLGDGRGEGNKEEVDWISIRLMLI
jgi:hypothetical protein